MAKKIGILVLGDTNWVGGLYYAVNIIKSFEFLSAEERPEVYAYYGNQIAKEELETLTYPHLRIKNYNESFGLNLLGKVCRELFRIDIKAGRLIRKNKLAAIYPYNYNSSVITKAKVVAWFPDFQHKFFPQYFSPHEIAKRDKYLNEISKRVKHIVFSSKTALNQFNKFYPGTKINSYVYSFVSAVDLSAIDETIPDKKFNIKKKYFVVSNQFWKHKNHLVVVRALAHLKSTGAIDFNIVFTGKQMDAVNQDYFLSVIDAVEKSNLSNDVHFLGFLDRNDQLSLMAGSMGVIQPSTFEGWSTVIEDAKSLNKQVFASAIDIHIEQLGEDGYFFKEHDFEDLAKLLSDYIEGIIQKKCSYLSFEVRATEASKNILSILV